MFATGAAGAGVFRKRGQQQEIGVVRHETEPAPRQIEPEQASHRSDPRAAGHQVETEQKEAAEDGNHHHPIEQLEGSLDAASQRQQHDAQKKRSDTDLIDRSGVGRRRHLSRGQIEHRACGQPGGIRPSDLQQIHDHVEPRPECARRGCAHEAGEGRLARRERVAHQLGIEDGLQEHRDERNPEE